MIKNKRELLTTERLKEDKLKETFTSLGQRQILQDLNGIELTMYRGKKLRSIYIGNFFTTSQIIAKRSAWLDEQPVYKCKLSVSNPLIIEANRNNYNAIVIDGNVYPRYYEKYLIRLYKKLFREGEYVRMPPHMSTDEIVVIGRFFLNIDSVIINNVLEIDCRTLTNDVIIYNERNIVGDLIEFNETEKETIDENESIVGINCNVFTNDRKK